MLQQIFPILDKENYSDSVTDQNGNSNMDNSSSTQSNETITTRNVINHDNDSI